jgi:hypothetical protein
MGYYRGDYYRGDDEEPEQLGYSEEYLASQPSSAPAEASMFSGLGALASRGAGALGRFMGSPAGSALTGATAGAIAERIARGGTRGGGRARTGGPRRYRRMNPLNPRALRRSMRRVQSFAKFARKTMTFVHAHKMKKHRRR